MTYSTADSSRAGQPSGNGDYAIHRAESDLNASRPLFRIQRRPESNLYPTPEEH